jgi:hypothetical protein
MWFLVFAMLGVLVLAGLVVLYVAFPHRGEQLPAVPWLGDAMRKGVDVVPTLDNTSDDVDPPDEHLDLTSLRHSVSESRGRHL